MYHLPVSKRKCVHSEHEHMPLGSTNSSSQFSADESRFNLDCDSLRGLDSEKRDHVTVYPAPLKEMEMQVRLFWMEPLLEGADNYMRFHVER